MWYICLIISAVIIGVSVWNVLPFVKGKNSKSVSAINVLLAGCMSAGVVMFLPIYNEMFASEHVVSRVFKTILVSAHHVIRMFIVDCDFEFIKNAVPGTDETLYAVYTCVLSLLFVVSPILTFGFLLSFFKNLTAYIKFAACYNKDVFVFSELNEKSEALALSVLEKNPSCKVSFINTNDAVMTESIGIRRYRRRTLTFKNVFSVNYKIHNPKKHITFVLLGKDESNNLKLGLDLISRYKDRKNTTLYVFASELEASILISSVDTGNMVVRRVSEPLSLVYNILEKTGEKLFSEAVEIDGNPEKKLISAAVVGLGRYGTEMLKSLSWFGQMEGYRLEINAFDKSENAGTHFCALCPELMDEKHNNKFDDEGESQYNIVIHDGIDADTQKFAEILGNIQKLSYVFVALGDDDKNIRTAVKIRILLEKRNIHPRIQAVVVNNDKISSVSNLTNHSGQSYDIDFVGEVKEFYRVGGIIQSEIEGDALKRHLKWGEEEAFWKYEYNYRSSMASALHRRMKIACGVSGINLAPEERSEEDRQKLRLMEHRRWNAYMRSEGYTYSEKRNNLAKTHHCLVTFDELSEQEKAKDDD